MTKPVSPTLPEAGTRDAGFVRGLNLFDATMIVVGVMIGSGIFIVSADMARLINSPGWLLMAWVVTGILTITAALSYGELASMMPHAGGMYVYLREAFSPLWGFLYGWTLFTAPVSSRSFGLRLARATTSFRPSPSVPITRSRSRPLN